MELLDAVEMVAQEELHPLMEHPQEELVVEAVAQMLVNHQMPHVEEDLFQALLWMVQLILEEVELVHLLTHHHQLADQVDQAS